MVRTKYPFPNIYGKTVVQLVRQKIISFFLNLLIVLVSISLTSGIGAITRSYAPGFVSNYRDRNAPDVILKYAPEEGETVLWNEERIDQVKAINGVKQVNKLFSIDKIDATNGNYRLLAFENIKEEGGVGLPTLLKGEYPSETLRQEEIDGQNYTVIDSLLLVGIHEESQYQIGDYVKIANPLMNGEIYIKVVGTASHPLYNSKQKERAMTEEENYLDNVFFTDVSMFGAYASFLSMTDLYVTLDHQSELLTSEYKSEINEYKNKIQTVFGDKVKVLTLEDNTSYALYKNYDNKLTVISIILPFFFIAVCALVVVVILSRLIADERSIIACNFSLGVPPSRIYAKYLFYSLTSASIGVIVGYFVGNAILPGIIFRAYKAVFYIPFMRYIAISPVGLITSLLVMLSTFLVAFFSIKLCLRETPAALMKAKAPKPGKRVFMEKIGFIWNRLSFSFKNSVRNIFRHKKNLILTSLSIIGSTTLVFLGLSLGDCSESVKSSVLFENVASTMGFISMVIVLYGVALASLIIYALTSMNIEERVREIAVLKVLGYTDIECAFFIYRELLLITVFSATIGIPVSMGASQLAFGFLDFGSLKDIRWPTYVLSYVIILASAVISCFLLFRKIKKVDFNISLKSLE